MPEGARAAPMNAEETCPAAERAASEPPSSRPLAPAVKKVMLLGLPNTGKSQTFNNLTGEYTLVANYHRTTLEAHGRTVTFGNGRWEVIDTPALHGLFAQSEEEVAVRRLLFDAQPDVIVQCIDANLLTHSLDLTADLLELRIPLVLCLNAMDETARRGVEIDSERLSQLLGVPVVESLASTGVGRGALRRAVLGARVSDAKVAYGDLLEGAVERIAATLAPEIPYGRALATLLLREDELVGEELLAAAGPDTARVCEEVVRETREAFRGNLGRILSARRNAWVEGLASEVVQARETGVPGRAEAAARLCRHPVFGPLILAGVLCLSFFLVVNGADAFAGAMQRFLWVPVEAVLHRSIPPGFWQELLVGRHGLVTFGLGNALLTVLPILSVFFLLYNTIEDTGYLPNASVMTRRVLERIGLSGYAVMPLILAFGCKTMATMTTRVLPSRKERLIAIYLIAFAIPCAPQLGLTLSVLARAGWKPLAVTVLVLGAAEVGSGVLLKRLLGGGPAAPFLQALPPMRLPSLRAVLVKTHYRIYWFLKEAVPAFVLAAALLFTLERLGLLAALERGLAPLVQGALGLPLEMVDALILCLARREAAPALILRMVDAGRLDWIATTVALVLTTTFLPCLANVVTLVKEAGWRVGLPMVAAINASGLLLAVAVNQTLRAFGGG
jgi:ferrous iron transport protein B